MDYLSNSNVPRRAADVAAGYDTMTLSSAPLNHILRLAAPPARHHQSMSMDNFEASLNYGANTLMYVGSSYFEDTEEAANALLQR